MTTVSMKVPKMVRWEDIRAIIGDARTEEIITLRYGPKLLGPPRITVSRTAVENMLAHMEGRTIEGMKPTAYQQAVPALFRLYFRQHPKAKSRFTLWLKELVATAPEATQVEGAALNMVADTKERRPMKAHIRMRNGKPVHVSGRP